MLITPADTYLLCLARQLHVYMFVCFFFQCTCTFLLAFMSAIGKHVRDKDGDGLCFCSVLVFFVCLFVFFATMFVTVNGYGELGCSVALQFLCLCFMRFVAGFWCGHLLGSGDISSDHF